MLRFALLLLMLPGMLGAMNDVNSRGPVRRRGIDVASPNVQNAVHSAGNVCMNVTNYGFMGNNAPEQSDRLLNPCPPGDWASQMEFPCGSNVQYLFQSALWIGAKIIDDTGAQVRVSVGVDGWLNPGVNELFPCEAAACGISRRSNIPGATDCFGNLIFDPAARAHEEFVAVYADTLLDNFWINEDPVDGAHRPLGIEIKQTTMQWATPQLGDFIIAEYVMRNFGTNELEDLYLGFFVDGDVGPAPPDAPFGQHDDDITGLLAVDTLTGDTMNIGWIADNDGRNSDLWPPAPLTAPAVMGLCALGVSQDSLLWSYNWWVSNGDASLDGGPRWTDAEDDGHTPMGDGDKYLRLSNRERDWDQVYAANADYVSAHPQQILDPCSGVASTHSWETCALMFESCADIGNGFDTRFLLSCGPFGEYDHDDSLGNCVYRLYPGESDTITMVWAIGPDFHNAAQPQPNPNQINPALFDFAGLLRSVRRAQMIYDSNYELQPPAAPTVFRAAGSLPEAVPLIWNRAGVGHVAVYRLYGIQGDSSRVLIGTNGAEDTTWTVAGLFNGDTLRFGLEAVDDSGFTSHLVYADAIVGAPLPVKGVTARAEGSTIIVRWNDVNDPEITQYRIHRTSSAGETNDFIATDEMLVDANLISGRVYQYVVRAENGRNLLSLPSDMVSAIPFAPQQRILVIDETWPATQGELMNFGGYRDGLVDSLYERVLDNLTLDFDVVHQHTDGPLLFTFEQLAGYDLVIWHAEDSQPHFDMTHADEREEMFAQYVASGGTVFREGRRVLSGKWFMIGQPRIGWPDYVNVPSGIDSCWAQPIRNAVPPHIKMAGAISAHDAFPTFEFDHSKIDSLRYANRRFTYYLEGEVAWPHDSAKVLYRANVTAEDSTGLASQPVAVADSDYIVLFFPLYLLHESDAEAILNNGIRFLRGQPLDATEPRSAPLAAAARLLPNFPNPFNPTTIIEYELRANLRVSVDLYDVLGRHVASLVDGVQAAGRQRVVWNGMDAASGIYFVRLQAGNIVETRKMVMVK